MGKPNSIKPVSTVQAPAAIGPYSQAVIVSNLVFCSGQIPLDPNTGELIEGDITKQTHQVIKNIKSVLEAGGTDLDHVVKTTVFLASMNDFSAMNKVYGKYFQGISPARTTIQVSALPKGALVEIEAVAQITQ